jgi:hypothetical protein
MVEPWFSLRPVISPTVSSTPWQDQGSCISRVNTRGRVRDSSSLSRGHDLLPLMGQDRGTIFRDRKLRRRNPRNL